eukprot:TRINITY_DN98626_c0_g1_i1.p2 TRINITY_DN98626_c0_g1~~TRINITY_DN98626_c0_g1_i1.p2  ORF type:complete len:110 (+),score=9.35 TRINITY_DN98626_c0_g1_i1:92-421(+)
MEPKGLDLPCMTAELCHRVSTGHIIKRDESIRTIASDKQERAVRGENYFLACARPRMQAFATATIENTNSGCKTCSHNQAPIGGECNVCERAVRIVKTEYALTSTNVPK